jgi:thioredoxin-dependent peroxiredoxin
MARIEKSAKGKAAGKKPAAAGRKSRDEGKAPPGYPAVGEPAPDFTLPASDGKTIRLSDFKGRKPVVLFFYPKDMTSGCTVEACGFRDAYAAFRAAGVEVFGVSADSLQSHGKFIEKYKLPYPLLSDESKAMLSQYGVWQEKSMYGRKYMGLARTTVVIDKAGNVAGVYEKVKPAGHPEEVLQFVRQNL